MGRLVAKRIVYNHGSGRLMVYFKQVGIAANDIVTLQTENEIWSAKVYATTDSNTRADRLTARFDDVWFSDLNTPCAITKVTLGHKYEFDYIPYVPRDHEVREWIETPERTAPVTLLASFPRSGSNFVQKTLDQNTRALKSASIYAKGRVSKRQVFLKSHASNMGLVRNELKTLWDYSGEIHDAFALIRDPRDALISSFDFVTERLGHAIDPADFLGHDYYYSFFPPDLTPSIRGEDMRPLNILQAYRVWVRHWITKRHAAGTVKLLRYEDLVATPQTAFKPLFEAFDAPMPSALEGLDHKAAQYGDSPRDRAVATGWRSAPALYAPIIETASKNLAPEIAALGYAQT